MNAHLSAAAVAGDIKMLYTLVGMDPFVLDKVDNIPFVHTPLHIAAAAGHFRFAAEIIRLKPSFAHKLNEQGLSPMHLAIQNVHMVRRFLSINKELVRVKGRKSLTPLHFAAKSGKVDSLAELLFGCQDSIDDLTVKGETALHVAVRKGQLHALRVLVEWLRRFSSYERQYRILNWKNDSGDTVLHVSARMNNEQAVELLIQKGVNLNDKNSDGSTALDIVEMQQFANTYIKNKLLHARAKSGTNVRDAPSLEKRIMSKFTVLDIFELQMIGALRLDDSTRSAVLVVAVLIATMTYQSALSPPGGLYPPDASANSTNDASSDRNSTTFRIFDLTGNFSIGTSTMSNGDFGLFWAFNTITLWASIIEIFLLLPTKSYSHFPLMVALMFFTMCYMYALYIISPNHALSKFCLSLAFFLPLVFVLLEYLKMYVKRTLQSKFAKWNNLMDALERK